MSVPSLKIIVSFRTKSRHLTAGRTLGLLLSKTLLSLLLQLQMPSIPLLPVLTLATHVSVPTSGYLQTLNVACRYGHMKQPWSLGGDTWTEEKAIFPVEICESGGKGRGGSPGFLLTI